MDYAPKYAQPFTFEQATLLDVPVIFEEIARLQNSLQHLKRTQDELQAFVDDSEKDPDIVQALEENRTVIGSQEERIDMLKMALSHKGVHTGVGSHYELSNDQALVMTPVLSTVPTQESTTSQPHINRTPPSHAQSGNGLEDDEDGVFL